MTLVLVEAERNIKNVVFTNKKEYKFMSEKVKCNACGKEYTTRGITRHLKSCPEIHKNDSNGMYKYYTLKIRDVYEKYYFLYINVSAEITLGQLDQFLRDIWLECCNHLSSFYYRNEYYDINRFTDSAAINLKLEKLLDDKDSILYEYDFGSTTKLEIELKEEFFDKKRDSLIEIYARNKMPKYLIENFDDPANSPRTGVCGYLGPKDEYKDIISWGKMKKVKKNKNEKDKDYKKLEKITNRFIKANPFKDIPSDLVFEIEDPKEKISYYCNFVGHESSDYELNIYIGDLGLMSLINRRFNLNDRDLFQSMNYITLVFMKKSDMFNYDIDFLKEYNYNTLYNLYPVFKTKYRSEPYKDIKKEEVKIFSLVLERLLSIHKDYKNNSEEINNQKDKNYVLKTFYENKKWKNKYVKLHPEFGSVFIDRFAINQIKRKCKKTLEKWELTSVFLDDVLKDGTFPEIIILQNKLSGEVINEDVIYGISYPTEIVRGFLNQTILKNNIIPQEITTNKDVYKYRLNEYLNEIGINISKKPLSGYMNDYINYIYSSNSKKIIDKIESNKKPNISSKDKENLKKLFDGLKKMNNGDFLK